MAVAPISTACGECGSKKNVMKLCTRCKSVYYCSVECQRKAWGSHKKDCGASPPPPRRPRRVGEAQGSRSRRQGPPSERDIASGARGMQGLRRFWHGGRPRHLPLGSAREDRRGGGGVRRAAEELPEVPGVGRGALAARRRGGQSSRPRLLRVPGALRDPVLVQRPRYGHVVGAGALLPRSCWEPAPPDALPVTTWGLRQGARAGGGGGGGGAPVRAAAL